MTRKIVALLICVVFASTVLGTAVTEQQVLHAGVDSGSNATLFVSGENCFGQDGERVCSIVFY
ncbi:MAG: hypothetical protein ABJN26_01240 [Stappiaceae bacterium]